MVYVNMAQKTVDYLDPQGPRRTEYPNHVLRWLGDCANDPNSLSYNIDFDSREWRAGTMTCPNQEDGNSCGVCVCMNIDLLAHSLPLTYSYTHIRQFRRKMCADLLRGDVNYPYDGVELIRNTRTNRQHFTPQKARLPAITPSTDMRTRATIASQTYVRTSEGKLYSVSRTPEDGNCLFFAVTRQQGRSGEHHEWRQKVCQRLLDYSSEYDIADALHDTTFQQTMQSEGKEVSARNYIAYMRQSGHFGTAVEIQAMADLLSARFDIYKYVHDQPEGETATIEWVACIKGTETEENADSEIHSLLWRMTETGVWHYEDIYPQAQPHVETQSFVMDRNKKQTPTTLSDQSLPPNHRTYHPYVWCDTEGKFQVIHNNEQVDSMFAAIAASPAVNLDRHLLRQAVCTEMTSQGNAQENSQGRESLSIGATTDTPKATDRADLLRFGLVGGSSTDIVTVAKVVGHPIAEYVLTGQRHHTGILEAKIEATHYPPLHRIITTVPIRLLWRTTRMGLRHYELVREITSSTTETGHDSIYHWT